MNKRTDISEEISIKEKINKALASLDGIKRAGANPFLYEKISQRMKDGGKITLPGRLFGTRFIFAAACAMILVLVLNFSVWQSYVSSVDSSGVKTTEQTQAKQDISSFAKEYFYQNSTYSY